MAGKYTGWRPYSYECSSIRRFQGRKRERHDIQTRGFPCHFLGNSVTSVFRIIDSAGVMNEEERISHLENEQALDLAAVAKLERIRSEVLALPRWGDQALRKELLRSNAQLLKSGKTRIAHRDRELRILRRNVERLQNGAPSQDWPGTVTAQTGAKLPLAYAIKVPSPSP